MPRATKAVRKIKQAERKFEQVEQRIEGKVRKFLEKDGPAETLAKSIDAATKEAGEDFERIAKKWSAKIKKLGEAFRAQAGR